MSLNKVNLKVGDLVRWVGPSNPQYIGRTAVVRYIKDNDPWTLLVKSSRAMEVAGLGEGWGNVPAQWEVVEKVNPRGEWGEEGL